MKLSVTDEQVGINHNKIYVRHERNFNVKCA
jgi:hypothetical protein